VIDMITNGNAENPPLWQRIFWAVGSGTVAAVLLVAGGLEALQTAAIVSALPLAVAMVFICYGLLRALQREGDTYSSQGPELVGQSAPLHWQQRLTAIVRFHPQQEITTFLHDTALPALQAVATQLQENGLAPQVDHQTT